MATDAQIRANRANAQLSTGPVTAEGKARVSSNRRTHGLAVSRHVILPNESAADYAALLAELLADLRPGSTLEEVFVHQAGEAHWKLRRLARHEAEFLERHPNPFLIEDEKVFRRYTTLKRYEAAALRSLHRALEEIRRLCAARERELSQSLDAALAIHTASAAGNPADRSKPNSLQPPADQAVAGPPDAPQMKKGDRLVDGLSPA